MYGLLSSYGSPRGKSVWITLIRLRILVTCALFQPDPALQVNRSDRSDVCGVALDLSAFQLLRLIYHASSGMRTRTIRVRYLCAFLVRSATCCKKFGCRVYFCVKYQALAVGQRADVADMMLIYACFRNGRIITGHKSRRM